MALEQTENQELMVIMQFVRKYAKLMIILFIIFVGVFVGSNYWKTSRIKTANEASQIFQEMVMAEIQQDVQSATAKGGQLLSDYPNSPYTQFAALLIAKMSVSSGDLDKAAEKLRWVMQQKGAQNIARHLAAVRLVSILIQQEKFDEALALVAKDPEPAYVTLYAQARGDVYVAKGDIEQAKKAYMLAIQSLPIGVQSQILQLKLLDLGGDQNA